jgi:hypothetical protein
MRVALIFMLSFIHLLMCAQEEELENLGGNIGENVNDLEAIDPNSDFQYGAIQVNINSATANDLLRVPGIGIKEAYEIIHHKDKFGDFLNYYELQILPSFTPEKIKGLIPYLTLINQQATDIQSLLKSGKRELTCRYQDDLKMINHPSSGFLGRMGKSLIKYKAQHGGNLLYGVLVENDAFEPMFNLYNPLFDFYTAFLEYRGIRKLRKLCLGDFRASFGEGLMIGSGFGMYKSYEGTNIYNLNWGIQKYSSLDENKFFRGVACDLKLKGTLITPFFSLNKIDAKLQERDSNLSRSWTSLNESGFHRTASDFLKKNNLTKMDLGINLEVDKGKLQYGFTVLNTKFSHPKIIGAGLYRINNSEGHGFVHYGFHYKWIYKNYYLSGEVSREHGKKYALIQKLLIGLGKKTDLLIAYRYYSPQYYAVNANSFGERSLVANEQGIYIGYRFKLNKVNLSGYADHYKFPWLVYLSSQPTYGTDYTIKIEKRHSRDNKMYLRCKREMKTSGTSKVITSKIRWHSDIKVSETISAALRMEYSSVTDLIDREKTKGIYLHHELGYKKGPGLKVNFRAAVFNTSNYQSRIYAYEKSVLHHYSIPFFYGKGFRYYSLIAYKFGKNLYCQMKFSRTVVYEELQNRNSTTVLFQTRLKF